MPGSPPDPYGDYEYDLVHEQGIEFEVPHAQRHESSPPPSPDPGGDYGYDEAHDFGSE